MWQSRTFTLFCTSQCYFEHICSFRKKRKNIFCLYSFLSIRVIQRDDFFICIELISLLSQDNHSLTVCLFLSSLSPELHFKSVEFRFSFLIPFQHLISHRNVLHDFTILCKILPGFRYPCYYILYCDNLYKLLYKDRTAIVLNQFS